MGRNTAEYNRIHKWLERHLEKIGTCFYCDNVGVTQWSNIDHQYRQDPTEYQEVCVKCHYNYDRYHLGVVNGRRTLLYQLNKELKDMRYEMNPPRLGWLHKQ